VSGFDDALARRPARERGEIFETQRGPFSALGRTIRAARARALFGEPDPSNVVSNAFQELVGSVPLPSDIPALAPLFQIAPELATPGLGPQETELLTRAVPEVERLQARGIGPLARDVGRIAALNPLTTATLAGGTIAGGAALARRTVPVLREAATRAAREPIIAVAGLPRGRRLPQTGIPGTAPEVATRQIGAGSAEGQAAVAGLGREAESFDQAFNRLWRQDVSPEEAAATAERMSGQKRPTGFDPARAVAQARFRALSEAGQGDIFTAALESRPAAARATVPTAETRRAAAPGAVEKPAEAGAPRKFQPTEVRTSELSFHAPFQNRASVTARGEFVDEEGIQQFLRDAGGKFDPDRRGRITVWKDNLGEIGERGRSYVLDGHHRVVLAASDWQLENGRYVSKGPVDRPMDAVRFRGNYQEALAFSRDANRGGRPNTYAETSASRSVSEEVGGALSRLIGEAPFEARIPRAAAAPVAPSTRIVPPAKPPRKRPPAPPAGGEPPDADAALKRIRAALRAAPALQREQKAIFRKVRGQVAAKMRSVRERVPGEAGVRERFRVMKTGPIERVQFESLRGKIAQVDVDALVDRINTHPKLAGEYDRQNAAVGLLKLFGQHGGAVPTDSELALLREVYGSDFVKDVLAKRPLIEKAWEAGVEVLNLPRALMATGDLSAPFRQGVVFVGAPKEFTRALGTMARAALSERKYVDALDRIKLRPSYGAMRDGGLALTEAGGVIAQREERFLSNLAEKIPLAGRLVSASNRGYVAFLNQLRADVFDDYLRAAIRAGVDRDDAAVRIASFVNAATGRGSLGALERAAPVLNGLFFSPRLAAGRITTPYHYLRLPAGARRRALQTLIADGALAASIMSLAKLGGAEVGTDARSADFLKVRFPTPRGNAPLSLIVGVPAFFGVGTQTYGGETRYDILAGQQQYMRLAVQLATGEVVSSTTGRVMRLGEGYKPITRKDVLARFIAQKENPVVSFVDEWLTGKDFRGQPFELDKAVRERLVPMVAQDLADLISEGGLEAPSLEFGVRGTPSVEADTTAGDSFEEALRRRASNQ